MSSLKTTRITAVKTEETRRNTDFEAEDPAARNAYLTILNGPYVGRTYRLGNGRLIVGRAPDCDVVVDDEGVSRRHALFVVGLDGSVTVEDLGSTNGSRINGKQQTMQVLNGGERLTFGSETVFKFEFRDSLEEQFAMHLYESATQDHLTGVFNERFLREQLRVEFAWHQRQQRPLSVIFLDIDHFKQVNDRYGHLAGDQVLRELAGRCLEAARTEDVLARYGGEEFTCLLRDTTASEATVVAERMRVAVMSRPFEFSIGSARHSAEVTISVGVAEMTQEHKQPEDLLGTADKRLYEAKKRGRNRVESPALQRPAAAI